MRPHRSKRRHRISAGLAPLLLCAASVGAAAGSLGGPLVLADEGSFFIGGESRRSETADMRGDAPVAGTIQTRQMYVQYRIPAESNGRPIIMVHGANHTGVTFETTPDGREGWATYFARQGFPVYVVDQSGRGRSNFDPSSINEAKRSGKTDGLPAIAIATRENAWTSYRLGPSFGAFWPNSRFPQAALDQYFAQSSSMAETTLPGALANTTENLKLLLDKIGPAILLTHSQSGALGLAAAKARPDKVQALVSVEGDCVPMSAQDIAGPMQRFPMLSVWGDHTFGFPSRNGDERRNGCSSSVNALREGGARADFVLLPERGITGNSHMMMLETNNLQIADLIIDWIKGAGTPKRAGASGQVR